MFMSGTVSFFTGATPMRLIADYTLGMIIVLSHLVLISLRGEQVEIHRLS
jgi:hypothetical protein